MKIEVGIVELLNTRVAVAFVDTAYVRPGAGDQLLSEVSRRLWHLTPVPVMLYSDDHRGYAPFQTHEFAARIRRENVIEWLEVDLDKAPWEHEQELEPPF